MNNERKSLLLRIPPALYAQLQRWADDELRSVNAQIEFVLREGVRRREGSRPNLEETGQAGKQSGLTTGASPEGLPPAGGSVDGPAEGPHSSSRRSPDSPQPGDT